MIIVSLNVRIGSVFAFTAIFVRMYNSRFRGLCNFFRAIRSPPPPPPPPPSSPKVTVGNKMRTYRLFKTTDNYKCEDYLHQVTNTRHRIALTKLRLSNHKLAIETGRYSRPSKKPAERTCPICKIEMEDEYHFLNICPAYQEKRSSLLDYLENEYRIKISRMSPDRIFMFLINPPSGNVRIQKLIAKHIFECFEKRKGEDGKVNTQ